MLRSRWGGMVLVAMISCGDNTPGIVVDAPLGSEPLEPAVLSAAPRSVEFGVASPTTPALASLAVTNVGQTASGPVMTSVTGSGADSFDAVSTTCTTLAPGATCTVSLQFAPSIPGTKSAVLNLTASPGGIEMVSLMGTALAGSGTMAISPASHQFGTFATGTPSAPTTFTISWNGLGSTGALTVTPAGTNLTDFAIASQTCSGAVLAPGDSCTIDVVFTPTATGGRSASFVLSASPVGGSAAFTVTGIGQ